MFPSAVSLHVNAACQASFPRIDGSDKEAAVAQSFPALRSSGSDRPTPGAEVRTLAAAGKYTMFLADGTPVAAIARSKLQDLAMAYLAEHPAMGRTDATGLRFMDYTDDACMNSAVGRRQLVSDGTSNTLQFGEE